MKKPIFGLATLFFAAIAPLVNAQYTEKPLRLMLDHQSTVDPVGILKNLGQKCPNVTLTTNIEQSDYLLSAWGWSGNYRLMITTKDGDQIFATQTAYLSNAVKDVCHFLNTRLQHMNS